MAVFEHLDRETDRKLRSAAEAYRASRAVDGRLPRITIADINIACADIIEPLIRPQIEGVAPNRNFIIDYLNWSHGFYLDQFPELSKDIMTTFLEEVRSLHLDDEKAIKKRNELASIIQAKISCEHLAVDDFVKVGLEAISLSVALGKHDVRAKAVQEISGFGSFVMVYMPKEDPSTSIVTPMS